MKKEVKIGILLYAVADFIAAAIAWFLFLYYRKQYYFPQSFDTFVRKIVANEWFNILFFIPLAWVILHIFSGAYYNPYRKSRITEIYRTLIISVLGSLALYFLIFLNDFRDDLQYYYKTFFVYLTIQFICTSIGRFLILNYIKRNINKGIFAHNTLIIGGNNKAIQIYQEILSNRVRLGYAFKGFVYSDESGSNGLSSFLPKLGSIHELEKIIKEHDIEEIIIAIDSVEHNKLEYILSQLSHSKTIVRITPDMYDIISGTVKTSNVWGAILIEIYPELMPDWQRVFKRFLDIVISITVLILLLPLYIFAAIKVKLSSPGTILYKQKRIGLYGKTFWIYKFRSMIANAEQNGPALSSENDVRITKWGKVMRKWRIDELPQFYNILKGEMSLVGPRPERKHFIDIIATQYPHYKYLHRVKPGLTSWGMVKYGYAENTAQMIERMKYDLLYIKNCSLALDFKIMIYTVIVILQGRGK